ncbi:Swi5-domain-containing protein [Immersiella caudata]|uniref:Swi5-domain-containing protein n=1 Tax=Immersiella caudata TaxID=314043 RepID=A0AA39WQ45_9PEZI|nr:Swi5-domain-containing protein [Immersiella caudata]
MQALPWKVEARIVSPLKIVLTGPGLDDSVEVEAEDEAEVNYILGESFFKTLAEHCEFFIEQEAEMLAVARLESAKAKLPPNVSAQSIVQNHIQLLKEYNEIKDIGQQLIGLIAENRGVTIGTLYENGDYGVTADD